MYVNVCVDGGFQSVRYKLAVDTLLQQVIILNIFVCLKEKVYLLMRLVPPSQQDHAAAKKTPPLI